LNEWLLSLSVSILVFLSALLIIGISNLWGLRRVERDGVPDRFPKVAVLVPARNEALNIRACIESLCAQEYDPFEIIALDDHSSDDTGAILQALASNPRVRVLNGAPLPLGWLGKHWACHQLARATEAELLLFTDADTRHHPHALRNAVAALRREHADLVTLLPRERVESWGEKWIVPLMLWSIFYFLPLALAHRIQVPALSATIGQFMLFRRTAYQAIGGHAAVRGHIADDLALGRRVIAAGMRWRLLDGSGRVECRMYHSGREAFEGFSKNLFAAFDYRPWLFVPIWLWLGIVFLAPFPLAFANSPAALPAIALSLLVWGLFYLRFRFPLFLALFYPLTVGLAVVIAFRSMALTLTGRGVWKGRILGSVTPTERRAE
jgi:chlorobactene glucosyltransferase